MPQLDEVDALCEEVHRLMDQLALRESAVTATMRVSTELIRKAKRARIDYERFYRATG